MTTASLAGILVATQPAPVVILAFSLVSLFILALITPLAALIMLLVLAPLRTLIETEAHLGLPLDIGQLAFLALLGSWGIQRIAHRQPLFRVSVSPIYLALLIFFVPITLSIFSAGSLGGWLNEWLKWVEMLLLVAFASLVARNAGWSWLVFALVVAAMANALVGLYEFLGGSGADHLWISEHYFRAFGTFGQPNPFGGFMGLVLPLAVMTALGDSVRLWQWWNMARKIELRSLLGVGFYSLAAALIGLGVVVSWSRGAWLGAAASAVAVAVALPRKAKQTVALLVVVLAVAGLLWFTGRLPQSVVARITSITEEYFTIRDVRGVDISSENYAVLERLAHWQAAVGMATDYPWLGVGFGNYEVAYGRYRLLNWEHPLGHAHNYYLNVLAETGIIGLTGYIGLWIGVFWLTWRSRAHPDVRARLTAVGLLGAWSYLAIHSLFDNLYVNNLFLHLGVMLGILAILHDATWKSTTLRGP